MIYFHAKIQDVKNDDFIFENPQSNEWALIKDGVKMKSLPTKEEMILYRQCLFGERYMQSILSMFEKPVLAPSLLYYIIGYAGNDSNNESMTKITLESVKWCEVFIYFDICKDTEDKEWDLIKEVIKQKYPNDYAERVFRASEIINDKKAQEKIKKFLDTPTTLPL